jgi:hypothetical protein
MDIDVAEGEGTHGCDSLSTAISAALQENCSKIVKDFERWPSGYLEGQASPSLKLGVRIGEEGIVDMYTDAKSIPPSSFLI